MTDEHRSYWSFPTDFARFGYMKRRIQALEREQSLMGKRVDELEARLRSENTGPIPGDIPNLDSDFATFANFFAQAQWEGDRVIIHDEIAVWPMTPPEQEDDPR